MPRKLWIPSFLVLIALSLGSGCSDDESGSITGVDTVDGNGVLGEATIDVAGVTSVVFSLPGQLQITQRAEPRCQLSIDENLLAHVEWTVSDNRVEIKAKDDTQLNPTLPIICAIQVEDLDAITVAGSVNVTMTDIAGDQVALILAGTSNLVGRGLDFEEIVTTTAGSSKVDLEGTAIRQGLIIAGTGSYMARSLSNEDAEVTISGAGSATVHAKSRLSVSIAGSGSVFYLGSPELDVNIQGSGQVVQIEG